MKNRIFELRGKNEVGWSLLETVAAIVVMGIGIALFMKVSGMVRHTTGSNTCSLKGGQLIESRIDLIRAKIAQDLVANWPASGTVFDTTVGPVNLHYDVYKAYSPSDGVEITNVHRITFKSWCAGASSSDTLEVSTYVSQRF